MQLPDFTTVVTATQTTTVEVQNLRHTAELPGGIHVELCRRWEDRHLPITSWSDIGHVRIVPRDSPGIWLNLIESEFWEEGLPCFAVTWTNPPQEIREQLDERLQSHRFEVYDDVFADGWWAPEVESPREFGTHPTCECLSDGTGDFRYQSWMAYPDESIEDAYQRLFDLFCSILRSTPESGTVTG